MAYNRHLAHVMRAIPEEIGRRPRDRHNLGELVWRPLVAGEPATLDALMADYVGSHLQHHLTQVLGPGWRRRG